MMSISPSVDLKGFASLVEPLLTVFASDSLGLHRISMSLSFQGSLGGYLMRPREHKNMICMFILFSEETELWCCLVWSQCNTDPYGSFFRFAFLQLMLAEHRIQGIWTKAFSSRGTVEETSSVQQMWAWSGGKPGHLSLLILWIRNIAWFQSASQLPNNTHQTGPCSVSVSTNPSAQLTWSHYVLLGLKRAYYIYWNAFPVAPRCHSSSISYPSIVFTPPNP